MYAIIQTCGKQYRVQPGDVLEFDRLHELPADGAVNFSEVLALASAEGLQVGKPTVAGAVVSGTLVEHHRGDKLVIFKMKRRKGNRRKNGFRAELTKVRIVDIRVGGKVVAEVAAKAAK